MRDSLDALEESVEALQSRAGAGTAIVGSVPVETS